ncbi:hypothetical protein [Flavobacterium sp. UMI-01]|uniref:hypothetical protein n=1 Tax=Flavobacterium sp. UMI-01 TaxID=1441053 RepID=UPI001C7CFE6A|nr:hypothetical protein [Flavobacterium sp. UMI-01]GIZ10294.1 hypothetical protein FUMI01_30180 [Flavobacterium sp. UMI-01]
MNKLDVNQVGGFPMTTRILDEIQKAHTVFNGLGSVAGNMTILSGCNVAGTTVSDGVVYVNGEVFEFRGGSTQTKVIIKEDTEALVFENNESKTVIRTRYVTFGTGVGAMNWADFKRPIETKAIPTDIVTRLETLEKKNAVFQAGGGMVLWNKPAADIPTGWAEVVDWRGRMPVGFDATQTEFNLMGKPGGAKNKTFSIAELPQHDHFMFSNDTVDAGVAITASNSPVKEGYNAGGDGNQNYRIRSSNNTPTVGKTSQKGSGQEFSLLNPYRVVMFIEYVG